MEINYSYATDAGRRERNEDSLVILKAQTGTHGQAAFAAVCDGMGGLSRGELASALLASACRQWFVRELPGLIGELSAEAGFPQILRDSWEKMIRETNQKLLLLDTEERGQLGTTIAGVLLLDNCYYIMNVGDSRIYEFHEDKSVILTHDQTLAMAEVDSGIFPLERLEEHPYGHVLLECVGVNEKVEVQYLSGKIEAETLYLICSDGFRHRLSVKELSEVFRPKRWISEEHIRRQMERLVRQALEKGEKDNITAVALLARPGGSHQRTG